MKVVELIARRAVGRDEQPARAEHTAELGEDAVLLLPGRHVVQHVAGDRRREPARRQVEIGRVATPDLDVGAREAIGERGREVRVELHGRELLRARAQAVGGEAGTRPDLDDVVAEVEIAQHGREHHLLDHLLPHGSAAELQVLFVHDGDGICDAPVSGWEPGSSGPLWSPSSASCARRGRT